MRIKTMVNQIGDVSPMWRMIFIIAMLGAPALADPLREATRPCRIERLDTAYALCVEALADRHELAIESAIGQTLSGIQAATGPELRALEARYAQAQAAWARAVRLGCGTSFPEQPRARADCRLQATISRADQVSESLALAADDLGGPVAMDIPVPDAVEVFIPLPGAPNGPGQRIRVPLVVPIN